MKQLRKSQNLFFTLFLGILLVFFNSCKPEEIEPTTGIISGIVSDGNSLAISGVTVTVSGLNEDDIVVTSDADGVYTAEGVSLNTHTLSFAKEGWLTISMTLSADKFDASNMASLDVTMVNAEAQITGTIIDAKNGGVALEGVDVSVGPAGSAISGSDGVYTIENLVEDDYTLTFTKANYVSITKEVVAADFISGIASFNVEMGSEELLPGLTANDLLDAEKWYYNEYRGGRNADAYPHWDWACNYMCTLDFQGGWQEQNEGTTLQIRNSEDEQSNPADLNVFDSFVYGSKSITSDNKILSLRVRTHDADDTAPAYFGVQVIDLSADSPKAEKVGEDKTYGSGDYTDLDFDLTDYVGKEVIIAIGIYRQQTGDYWKQLVLRAIRFADVKVENWDWLPGTEVVSGWKLTEETVRSTMPHTKALFSGISPLSGNRDNYFDAYRSWREVAHVAAEWSFVPVRKDPEIFASEGYIIKTRNTPEVDTEIPESYLYSKFAVASGSNLLVLKARNFGANYTYFKISAIQDDGTVSHLAPQSNTALDASSAENGCWKFNHEDGGADNPEGYASFTYDLSQFDGQNVLITLGVYNGAADTGENKLAIHSIELK